MFGKLIAPLSIENFVNSYQGQTAYHSRGSREQFTELFQWDDVNDHLSNARPNDPAIRLVTEDGPKPFVSSDALRDHLSLGKTVVIDNLQQVDPAIRAFCESLSSELNNSVTANCYVSNPQAKGFAMHYDAHDVLILQTEGSKRWQVKQASESWPIDNCDSDDSAPQTNPYLDVIMNVGDVLYIPRGHWHKAVAVEPCVHLTITIPSTNGVVFLKDLIEQLGTEMPILRKELPIVDIKSLGGSQDELLIDEQLNSLSKTLVEILDDPARMKQYLLDHAVRNTPISQEIQIGASDGVATELLETTKLHITPGQKFIIDKRGDSEVRVVASGTNLVISDIDANLVTAMLAKNGGFTGGELLEKNYPDKTSITWKQLKPIVVGLLNHGILKFK